MLETEQTFTVTIRHTSLEEIPAELVFLAVQDAVGPTDERLAGFEIEYVDATVAPTRYALVDANIADRERIAAYLPANYELVGGARTVGDRAQFLIAGRDNAGWTLDGYVIPRLASGMYYAVELA